MIFLLFSIAAYGGFHLIVKQGQKEGAGGPVVAFYTSAGATTAQAPFWAAVRTGWPSPMTLETHYWKDISDLRNTMLAGKGSVWVGHIDGFAQAAMKGAPVTLVAVTAWRKFHFLTTDDEVTTLKSLASKLSASGEQLAVAPHDSPAFAILSALEQQGGPQFSLSRHAPRQLMLEAVRGNARHVLVPEPLATLLLQKRPQFRLVTCLEEEYSRMTGGNGMLPVTGIAVHADMIRDHPAEVARLVSAMTEWADKQTQSTAADAVLAVLPESAIKEWGVETVRDSITRDPVRVVPAWSAREDVLAYLSVVLPEAVGTQGVKLPKSFFLERR